MKRFLFIFILVPMFVGNLCAAEADFESGYRKSPMVPVKQFADLTRDERRTVIFWGRVVDRTLNKVLGLSNKIFIPNGEEQKTPAQAEAVGEAIRLLRVTERQIGSNVPEDLHRFVHSYGEFIKLEMPSEHMTYTWPLSALREFLERVGVQTLSKMQLGSEYLKKYKKHKKHKKHKKRVWVPVGVQTPNSSIHDDVTHDSVAGAPEVDVEAEVVGPVVTTQEDSVATQGHVEGAASELPVVPEVSATFVSDSPVSPTSTAFQPVAVAQAVAVATESPAMPDSVSVSPAISAPVSSVTDSPASTVVRPVVVADSMSAAHGTADTPEVRESTTVGTGSPSATQEVLVVTQDYVDVPQAGVDHAEGASEHPAVSVSAFPTSSTGATHLSDTRMHWETGRRTNIQDYAQLIRDKDFLDETGRATQHCDGQRVPLYELRQFDGAHHITGTTILSARLKYLYWGVLGIAATACAWYVLTHSPVQILRNAFNVVSKSISFIGSLC